MPLQIDPLTDRVAWVGKARQGRQTAHVATWFVHVNKSQVVGCMRAALARHLTNILMCVICSNTVLVWIYNHKLSQV